MAILIYVLCFLTSLACGVLLLRGYLRTRVRLLLWSGGCFAFFALNNLLLVVDETIGPRYDLTLARSLPAVIGIALLLYGLVWETDS